MSFSWDRRTRSICIEICLLVGLGALIFSPSVRSHLFLDDYLHAAMVDGTYPVSRGPFDLYDFIGKDSRAALFAHGLLPWWTESELTIRFFRPIASALLYLEHRFFSHAPLPMHVCSFAWWLVAVFAARALFQRTLAERPARMATFIFALGPCHVLPIAWLANSVTLVSLAFGTGGLVFYAAWRQERRVLHGVLAAVLFALAFLGGGEYTLGFGGYVIAIELVRQSDSIVRRISGLSAFLLPTLGYLAVRQVGGYGSRGSGFYTDPLNDVIGFLVDAPLRMASLLGSSWLTFDVAYWLNTPTTRTVLVLSLLALAVVVVPIFRRILTRLPDAHRRAATWLLYGSFMALVPSLAVAPGSRVVGASMLGVAAAVAVILEHVWFADANDAKDETTSLGKLAPLAALALGFIHFVHGPGTAFLGGDRQRDAAFDFERRIAAIRGAVDDVSQKQLGIVRGLTGVFFMPFALDSKKPLPPRWLVLSHATHVLALRRDRHTLDLVAPTDSALYPMAEHSLYRSTRAPLEKGDEIRVPGLTVKILETTERGARSARFTFDEDLDAFPWISDDYDTSRKAEIPDVGFGDVFDARGQLPTLPPTTKPND